MDFTVNIQIGTQDDLLAVAAYHARDTEAVCSDVSAMIFPTASVPPSEELLANISAKLVSLVSLIERKLVPEREIMPGILPQSWDILARSGFLREPELIDFVLARAAEDRLEIRIQASGEHSPINQLPARLLDHPDASIADTAQMLLAADSMHRGSGGLSYRELRPELLHQICWRIVAALEVSVGVKSVDTSDAARNLLAEYDENQTAQTSAQKLVHFLDGDLRMEAFDPEKAGPHIFVATIAVQLSIDHDHVLRLIDAHSLAPLATMLRACSIDKERAMAIIYLIKGFALTPREISLFDQCYSSLDINQAVSDIRGWGVKRAQFLLGHGVGGIR